jgi:cobalt-zinc-cadmium efflux system membrane fusion protein
MSNQIKRFFPIVLSLFIFGCDLTHDHDVVEKKEAPTVSVTLYNKATELFMEYPQIVIDSACKFLIHLTDLKDFKAVVTGTLEIIFTHESGEKIVITENKPARDGIYTPTVKFNKVGKYKMEMNLTGTQVSDEITVPDLVVYASEKNFPAEKEESASLISFLKEQQWKIDYATETASLRDIQASVSATGEFVAKPELYSKVISPLSGIILVKKNGNFPRIGTYVKKGSILLHISPTADAGMNLQKIKSDYLLAKSELERVQLLFDKKAVAKKRLDEALSDFETKSAIYNALLDQVKLTENGYSVHAPIDGFIDNVSISLGSHVSSGQDLVTIINPSRIILKVNIPASKFETANRATDASFKIEGHEEEFQLAKLGGKKIAVSSTVNTSTRTIPVYFEINNPKNLIKIGMYSEVNIKSGNQEESLTIPESAIVEEDGILQAYVLIGGESFEKRILKTGTKEDGYVQILSGLKEGERVVTKGAYQVRLAALSPETAIGEGHAH